MVGTIIGAGIFGLPAAFARVGFVPATLLFFILAFAVTATHLILAEQMLATTSRERLAGIARRGLGEFAFRATSITYPLGILAANFAYIILGGEFLSVMARGLGFELSVAMWQILFWVAGALTVIFGLKLVSRVEAVATAALVVAIGIALYYAWPLIDAHQIITATWDNWHLPFGVFLFSLSGITVVGEVVEITARRRREVYLAIVAGTFVSALLSWSFGAVLFLAAHGYPIRHAVDIVSVLPAGAAWIVPLLGFLAVATSYITTAQDLRVSLEQDQKWKPHTALAASLCTPLAMLALFSRDFLSTIGFIGSVFIGFNGIIIGALGYKALLRHRDYLRHVLGTAGCALLISVYLFGILQRLLSRTTL
jgi:tyrosine-specific transport protein